MFNLKSLALASTLTLGSLFGGVAQAAPSECFLTDPASNTAQQYTCDLSVRTNSNGHKVNDYVLFDHNGGAPLKFSVIYWLKNGRPAYAETFGSNGYRQAVDAWATTKGFWCVDLGETHFCNR